MTDREFEVQVGPLALVGDLVQPDDAFALVMFAHGSGSSRRSPRNREVAAVLQSHGLATLLFDLLRPDEAEDRRNVFDVELLGARVVQAVDWAAAQPALGRWPVGLFGASTGAAAALLAAAERPARIGAVVSRGGRPDLAAPWLARVAAPTLLIVGGADTQVLELNRLALDRLGGPKRLDVVARATHLFEEPGALDRVAELAATWFVAHLPRPA